ncbi:MAG: hypothetical protein K2X82_09005 [Gemmataceae bacterium]|nr:hypothetical protein [Gemmataceae bacterium]
MPRLLAVLVVPVVLAAAPAAPVPEHIREAAGPYYPTAVGTKLVYALTTGEVADVVTAVERVPGGLLVTTRTCWPDGTEVARGTVRVTAKGLFEVAEGGQEHDPPRCLLELPSRAGRQWDLLRIGRDGRIDHQFAVTAGGIEEVEVPAGRFRAARVDAECWGVPITCWYAPKVGLVRMDLSGGTGRALKSVTPGKP